MPAPQDFRPVAVNMQSLPYVGPPTWHLWEKFPRDYFVPADQHALEVAKLQHDSFRDLLFDLVYSKSWTQLEGLRIIFRWLTVKDLYNIKFAATPKGSPEELIFNFRYNKCTYGRIFELICLYSGLPCLSVAGYAKGVEFRPGHKFGKAAPNHSWNVVFVEGSWQIVDTHWAARFLQSNDSNKPEDIVYDFDDFYFCPDPREFAYSHFPEASKWQLLSVPITQAEFEDVPVAKSYFFRCQLSFVSHHRAVVAAQNGCLQLSINTPNLLTFTYKLLFSDSCRDEYNGVKLSRYAMQETKPGQVNYYIKAPQPGFYYFTVYAAATPVYKKASHESVYRAVCEYKILVDTPSADPSPYPFVSHTNWGPGATLIESGLVPHQKDTVILAPSGHAELSFDKHKPLRVIAKMQHAKIPEKQCEQYVTLVDDYDDFARIAFELPQKGEYAVEIYANDPAKDGNTYTQVCQYLLVRPERADGKDAQLPQAQVYPDCYEVHGQKVRVPPLSAESEALQRSLDSARLTAPPSRQQQLAGAGLLKPGSRDSASIDALAPGVGVTVTVTPGKPGSREGTMEKPAVPSKSGKLPPPSVASKPATKPKPGAAGAGSGAAPVGRDVKEELLAGVAPGTYTLESEAYGGAPLGRGVARAGGQVRPEDRFSQEFLGAPGQNVGIGGSASIDPLYANVSYGTGVASGTGVPSDARYTATAGAGVPGDGRRLAAGGGQGVPGASGVDDGRYTASAGLPSGAVDPRYGGAGGPVDAAGQPKYSSSAGFTVGSGAAPADGKFVTSITGADTKFGVSVDPSQAKYAASAGGRFGPGSAYGDERFESQMQGVQPGGLQGGAAPGGSSSIAGSSTRQMPSKRSSKGYGSDNQTDEFPPPPAASEMLTIDFAPMRAQSEIPVAPASFQAVKITSVERTPAPLPVPLTDAEAENMTFSVDRAQHFKSLDIHAIQVSKTEHNSFKDLIWDLIYSQNITDDLEKARVIFLWLCTKDLSKMNFSKVAPGSPEEILLGLKEGKATYAKIFDTLCSYAGLHSTVVMGYAKGADYKPGMRFQGSSAFHAWNAVVIHGHYRLIDCHWASRRMIGKKGTENIRYELDDYYFLVDPRQLIYTHYPEDKRWQLLEHPYTLAEFEDLPPVKSLFFRYSLKLETHTNAVIKTNDSFSLSLNYEQYRGPGLEFTFSLHSDDGKETLNGVKLSRFGLQEVTPERRANFWVRLPGRSSYKFVIYAREVNADGSGGERMYSAVAEYQVIVDAPYAPEPFPDCSGATWGLSPVAAQRHSVSTKFTSGIVPTSNGQCEVRFKLNKQLLFSGKLKGNGVSEAELQSCILYRTVGDTAIFSVSVPGRGEFGLEVFVNDPTRDGKTLRHMCQYLMLCAEDRVSGIRFPQLPAAYLGPQPAYTNLGLTTTSHKDPLIHTLTGEVDVQFAASRPLRATSNLILTVGSGQDLSEYVLQQYRTGTLSFLVRLPAPGIYKFQIFAQPLDDSSDSLPGVYNYLINCSAVPPGRPAPLPYPRQFSQWKEGCYLYEPVDGNLAACQPASDPTPQYIFYRVEVPRASKVAVVVGSEWTHLESAGNGVFQGAAYFQAGWGKEESAALTANYGGDSASYNTLLEYAMM